MSTPAAPAVVHSTQVKIGWNPVTVNKDGSPVTVLYYRIRYGMNVSNQPYGLSNITTTSAIISNLTSGTWYFSVQAVSAAGAGDWSPQFGLTL